MKQSQLTNDTAIASQNVSLIARKKSSYKFLEIVISNIRNNNSLNSVDYTIERKNNHPIFCIYGVYMKFIGFILVFFLLALSGSFSEEVPQKIMIDWRRSDGQINRAIFSTQGFMQVYVCENPMVLDTFTLINPSQTHTRLETYIHQMEPENDNDDPNVFNWEKFYPQKMIRFIDNRDMFEKTVASLGMTPLSLLCYNVAWLKSDDPKNPIKDIHEWAEFAAAVVQSYNGFGSEYHPNLRFVEIWNEPNMEQFYTGTMESYFALFNATADRIHRDYPGVMVGGPALTHAPQCNPDEWMEAFLIHCGSKADVISYHHYGPQGEPVEVLTNDIKKWTEKFRAIPGKEKGKVMLTEIDSWFQGWNKMDFIMERQFRFLDLSDLILSIHHFCCLAYNESGNYTFGIVDTRGGVIGGTFWPYWLFRNLIGEKSFIAKEGAESNDIDLIASHYEKDGQQLGAATIRNKKKAPTAINTILYFQPSNKDRVLAINRVNEKTQGLDKVQKIPAKADSFSLNLTLSAKEGVGLVLQESGKKIFAFRDLNNQETPWLETACDKDKIGLGDACVLSVRILNTNFNPISGRISIGGVPEGWKSEPLDNSFRINNLAFGESAAAKFIVKADAVIKDSAAALYAILEPEKGDDESLTPIKHTELPHSIPATIEFVSPLKTQVLPLPVYAVRGEINQVCLLMSNLTAKQLEGRFGFKAPDGCAAKSPADSFSIPPHSAKRYYFSFEIPITAKFGEFSGEITIDYLGSRGVERFTIEVGETPAFKNVVPLDLSKWLNMDAVAYFSNRMDYDRAKIGLFSYPADYTPSDVIQNIGGVPYRFASMENGKKNVILPQGQKIEVPLAKYSGVSFIGYGHDGKHHGDWIFNYADGASQKVASQIPEWCTPPPDGFKVACKAPYRYIEGGPAPPPCELFVWTLPIDSGSQLKSIELPQMNHAYIFCITLIE